MEVNYARSSPSRGGCRTKGEIVLVIHFQCGALTSLIAKYYVTSNQQQMTDKFFLIA